MTGNILYCASCDFQVERRVDGEATGYDIMAKHTADEHAEEYRLVQEGLAELDEDIRRAEEEAEGTY
ncbi:hypothetical protein LCGC14_2039670 [marine sediment metagenome]|uniref:DUF1059 domain-containing protein n=1 Tax=marine sediment metagenome TaxID=412755 RepID=A0A0F9H5P9_9ZZZZ